MRTLLLTCLFCASACSTRAPHHHPSERALGPYSAAVETGRLCFVSGKVGARRESFAAEVESAIDAVEADLERAGLALSDAVSVTVYLADIALYPELNTIYARRFREPWPARACVAVSALPGKARVEIQVVAARR